MAAVPSAAPDLAAVHFEEQNCAICLEPVLDRCVLPQCFHSCFCFPCILEWLRTQQTKKTCPLCVAPVGRVVLHNLGPSVQNFTVHHLDDDMQKQLEELAEELEEDEEASTPHLRDPCPAPRPDLETVRRREEQRHRRKLNAALDKRRRVYRYRRYAKHVASNRYTKYRPYPGPVGFQSNATHARLLSVFLQRELQVWPHLDIAFLSYYIPALLSHVDIRSDMVLQRLTEWIGSTEDAHQLVHEMELFVRSGRGGLGLDQYDTSPWLQYDDLV